MCDVITDAVHASSQPATPLRQLTDSPLLASDQSL
jgi:hypothetical protein